MLPIFSDPGCLCADARLVCVGHAHILKIRATNFSVMKHVENGLVTLMRSISDMNVT